MFNCIYACIWYTMYIFFFSNLILLLSLNRICVSTEVKRTSHSIWLVSLMVFNATFNNISVILWRTILLLEETRVPGENHRPVASHWQT
jgi:hypothetical protein